MVISGNHTSNTRTISDVEKALLLIESLQTGELLHLVNMFFFPETIDLTKLAPILTFNRLDQKRMLDQLMLLINEDSLKVK